MTRTDLKMHMLRESIDPSHSFITDDAYDLPSREFFFGPFADALKLFYQEIHLAKWFKHSNNCAKFSLGARWFGAMLHHSTRPNGGSLAIGEYFFQVRGGDIGHAHIFAVVKEGNSHTTLFMEPQNQLERFHNAEDRRRCSGFIV